MDGRPGADAIAYHQGGPGSIYITDVLVTMEMFNCERFDRKRHPHYLLSRSKSALEFYQKAARRDPGYRDVQEVKTAEEDLMFSLPKELRKDLSGKADGRALGGRGR